MSDLVERYVHQVGRYLPKKERADIEAELRSLIQDQLDDRFEGSPSQAEIATVLTELGDPRQIAASYNREQYLVGPDLYPYMMTILRHVWVIVPTVVIFLNIFGALSSASQGTLFDLLLETLASVLQTTLMFSAVVVLIFGLIQRVIAELNEKEKGFDPLTLPKVDDPHTVDRYEAIFGSLFGAFILLVLGYFLQVGGLTLRFNLSDPGDVIPFPLEWMILTIAAVVAQVIIVMTALWRNQWSIGLWLAQSVMETVGVICLYFVIFEPIFERLISDNTRLSQLPFIGSGAEIITIIIAIPTLLNKAIKMVSLWTYGKKRPTSLQRSAR